MSSNSLRFAFLANAILANCLTVDYGYRDIATKTKIELSPILVSCMKNDIIRISAPIINDQTQYYLHKPNGDVNRLYLHPLGELERGDGVRGMLNVLVRKEISPVLSPESRVKVFSLKQSRDILEENESEMRANDFLLGPVQEEDHGNWLLSVYSRDFNEEWIELFQVITIEIVEFTLISPKEVTLDEGNTFHINYAYPIPNIKSCQLLAPESTYDRFYRRDTKIEFDRCGFVLPNVTKADEGQWKITAVGRIVYEGIANLYVRRKKKTRNKT